MPEAATFDVEGLVKGYKRSKGWHCEFYTPAGRQRKSLSTRNKRQAQTRARDIADAIKAENWESLPKLDWKPKPEVGTFSTFIVRDFLPKYCEWSDRTRQGEQSRLRIVQTEFGTLPLQAITAAGIKTWLAKREKEGLSVASSNRYLSILKSVFKAAVTYGACKINPAAGIRTKAEDVKTRDILNDDEFERLLTELPDYARSIVLAAAETGMRRGEMRGLRWGDVDLPSCELRVAKAKNKEFRIVPLTPRIHRLLSEMEAAATPHPTAPVFFQGDIKKSLATALKRAGIEKHITLHSFRHQFATRALEAGVSEYHLRAIGGWKSPVMLQRYGKVRNRALHEQMAKLDRSSA